MKRPYRLLTSVCFAFVTALVILCYGRVASAVTCTLSGTVKVEPLDEFYCDTNYLNCSQYAEVDLDTKRGATAAPLRFMDITIIPGGVGDPHLRVSTDANGFFSGTFVTSAGTCSGLYTQILYYYRRVHESDLAAANPRYRFRMVNFSDQQGDWYYGTNLNLTGTTTTQNLTFNASANPTLATRLANMYYTANSAISEMKTWSTNLDTGLASTTFGSGAGTILRLAVGTAWASGGGVFHRTTWSIDYAYDVYPFGMIIRHELGHAVHFVMHHFHQWSQPCYSDLFNGVAGYPANSCEYGSTATFEALGTFFGIRSLTSDDTTVFDCSCNDPNNQDICSRTAASVNDPDGDMVTTCKAVDGTGNFGTWRAVGDRWVNSVNQCTFLSPSAGCDCTDDGTGNCVSSYRLHNGWRNTTQVLRFLWDMLDTNNEGSDTTDLTISGFAQVFESMPCTGDDFAADGSCNEFNRGSDPYCNPSSPGPNPGLPMTGTRDSYNVWDLAEAIPGVQGPERTLNCVDNASD